MKLWKRGTPLSSAATVSEGIKKDVVVSRDDPCRRKPDVADPDREVDFYHHKISHVAPNGKLVPSPLPDDADIQDVLDGRVIAALRVRGRAAPAGALVAYSIPDLLAGNKPAIETVFVPNEHQAVEEVSASKSRSSGSNISMTSRAA